MELINVFLAEDDADDRYFFQEAFISSTIPAEITAVEDGQQLTNLLNAIVEPPPPDIIFLDINMPRKNGKQCLKEIRSNQKFNLTPIIIFTTSAYYKDVEETFKNGASRYITKMDFFDNGTSILNKLFSENWRESLLTPQKGQFLLKN